MNFLEKDLEQIIYETLKDKNGIGLLENKGLKIGDPQRIFKQLRIGNYGVADLVTLERPYFSVSDEHSGGYHVFNVNIKVFELKKEKISVSAFLQAVRYAKGIKRYINGFRNKNFSIDFELILIGRSIENDLIYLPDLIPDGSEFGVSIYTYNYGINGIDFKYEHCYYLENENFYK